MMNTTKETKTNIIKEAQINGYTVTIFKENDPGETGYKMYAEVRDLSGCFIAGDTEKEILAEAPGVIEMFADALKEVEKEKPKLISVKVKPALNDLLAKYAEDNGIESISTALRSLAVTKLREKGYSVSSKYAISH